jgi:peptidoglycan hydrolase-like protein with peptidoglycan-binding domain
VNYCQQGPDEIFDTALGNVVDILEPAKLKVASKQQTVQLGDARVSFYPETLRLAQQRLVTLGYMSGKADGKPGKGTQEALLAYQKKLGKSPTGLPDADTILSLVLGK